MNARIFLCGLFPVFLFGCYDDVLVTMKEPHVYKGKIDVHALDASTRAERLAARFNAVQLDR